MRLSLLVVIAALAAGSLCSVVVTGDFSHIGTPASTKGQIYMFSLAKQRWTLVASVAEGWRGRVVYAQRQRLVYIAGPPTFSGTTLPSVSSIFAYDTILENAMSSMSGGLDGTVDDVYYDAASDSLFVAGSFTNARCTSQTCVGLAAWKESTASWQFVASPPAGLLNAKMVRMLGTRLLVSWDGSLFYLENGQWKSMHLTGVAGITSCPTVPTAVFVRTGNNSIYQCTEESLSCTWRQDASSSRQLTSLACMHGDLVTATRSPADVVYAQGSQIKARVAVDGAQELSSLSYDLVQATLPLPWAGYSIDSDILVAGAFDILQANDNYQHFPGAAIWNPQLQTLTAVPGLKGAPTLSRGKFFAASSPDVLFGFFIASPTDESGLAHMHGPGLFSPALGEVSLAHSPSPGLPVFGQPRTFVQASRETLRSLSLGRNYRIQSIAYDPAQDMMMTTMQATVNGELDLIMSPFNMTDLQPLAVWRQAMKLQSTHSAVVFSAATGLFYATPLDMNPSFMGPMFALSVVAGGNPLNFVKTPLGLPADVMCRSRLTGCIITAAGSLRDGFVVAVETDTTHTRLFRYIDTFPQRWVHFPNISLDQPRPPAHFNSSGALGSIVSQLVYDGRHTLFAAGALSRVLPGGAVQYAAAAIDINTGLDVPLPWWRGTAAMRVDAFAVSAQGTPAERGPEDWVVAAGVVAGGQAEILVGSAPEMQAFGVTGPASLAINGDFVQDIAIDPATLDVVVGGAFTQVEGVPSSYMALFVLNSSVVPAGAAEKYPQRTFRVSPLQNSFPNAPVRNLLLRQPAPVPCSAYKDCGQCTQRVECAWCRGPYTNMLEDGACVALAAAESEWDLAGDHDYNTTCAVAPFECLDTFMWSFPPFLFGIGALLILLTLLPPGYLFATQAISAHRERKRARAVAELNVNAASLDAPGTEYVPPPPPPRQEQPLL